MNEYLQPQDSVKYPLYKPWIYRSPFPRARWYRDIYGAVQAARRSQSWELLDKLMSQVDVETEDVRILYEWLYATRKGIYALPLRKVFFQQVRARFVRIYGERSVQQHIDRLQFDPAVMFGAVYGRQGSQSRQQFLQESGFLNRGQFPTPQ